MSKDRLLELVWPGLVVEEVNLSVNISAIRKILGAEAAQWIETVPRQGYRFKAPVEVADVATLAPTGSRTDAQSTKLARLPSADVEAHQAYVQGRFLWNQRSEASLIRAAEHFRSAIQRDPGFALAYAALADTHTTLGYLGYVPPVSTFPVARPYALEALTLDPSLAQAHAALAYIKFYFDWDWEGARQEFRRALDLDPGDPVSHQWHAVFLLATGQPGKRIARSRPRTGSIHCRSRSTPTSAFTITTMAGTPRRSRNYCPCWA
jgi:tetratricopeptide (TPR) repeat protein